MVFPFPKVEAEDELCLEVKSPFLRELSVWGVGILDGSALGGRTVEFDESGVYLLPEKMDLVLVVVVVVLFKGAGGSQGLHHLLPWRARVSCRRPQ